MNRCSMSLLIALLALASQTGLAAVFERDWKTPGDGRLTYDDVHQREWLDLTESVLLRFPGSNFLARFENARAQLQPGGVFQDFTPANSREVSALAESAGINTTTLDFSANYAASGNLIILLGVTHQDLTSISSWGVVLDAPPGRDAELSAMVTVENSPEAGLKFIQTDRSDYGLWLYRQVPEPWAVQMATIVIALLSLRRRHRLAV